MKRCKWGRGWKERKEEWSRRGREMEEGEGKDEGILMGREDIAGMRDKEVERRRVTGGRWWRFYE